MIFALRRYKIDVLTPNEYQTTGLTDEKQLEVAASLNRAILTYNARDFAPLHLQFIENEIEHSGIIICRQDRFEIGESIRQIHNLRNNKTAEEMRNNIEYLSNWKL